MNGEASARIVPNEKIHDGTMELKWAETAEIIISRHVWCVCVYTQENQK